MGRLAYLQRIAYGRSSHEHPVREETQVLSSNHDVPHLGSSVESGNDAASVHEENLYREWTQPFNERGHPVNPDSRAHGRRIRNASNNVLSVIGVVEKSEDHLDSAYVPEGTLVEAPETEHLVGDLIGISTIISYDVLSWFTASLTNRIVVYGTSPGTNLIGLAALQRRTIGPNAFHFSGILPSLVSVLASPRSLTSLLIYPIDRVVVALAYSRKVRSLYSTYVKPSTTVVLEIICSMALFPLRMHSLFQTLGLIPPNDLLPNWQTMIPFSSASPFRFPSSPLPLLLLLIYQPLGQEVHRRVVRFFQPAKLSKSAATKAKDSGQSVGANSKPNRKNASWLAQTWINTLSTAKSYLALFTPHPHNQTTNRNIPQISISDSSIGEQSVRNNTTSPNGQTTTPPSDPPHQPPNDPEPAHEVTIRISSYDANSSTVNLEIGVPEESSGHRAAASSTTRKPKPVSHRISRLVTVSQDVAASVRNHFVTGLVLLPVKAVIVRMMVAHVARMDGVVPDARFLIGLAPGSGLVGTGMFESAGAFAEWVSKITLCMMADAAMGMAMGLAEFWATKWIGIRFFGWGSL